MRTRYVLIATAFVIVLLLSNFNAIGSKEICRNAIRHNGSHNLSSQSRRISSGSSNMYTGTPTVEWELKIGSPNARDSCGEIHQTSDGNYIVAGVYSFNVEDRAYLAKISSDGSLLWSRTYGKSSTIDEFLIVREVGSGYIAAGNTNSFSDNLDYWLVKLDSNGNIEWQKTYFYESPDYLSVEHLLDLMVLKDGYIIVGTTLAGPDSPNPFIVRTDRKGNVMWQKLYDFDPSSNKGSDTLMSIEKAKNGYILCGTVLPPLSGNYDIWIVKIDYQGNIIWQKTYDSGYSLDSGRIIKKAHDGGYIIVGKSRNPWVMKIDENGNVIWSKEYSYSGYDDSILDMEVTKDGYVFVGRENGPYGDVWIFKTDFSGNEKWEMVIRAEDSSVGSYIEQTKDGGYIVGADYYYSDYNSDIWVIKLTSDEQLDYKPARPEGPTEVEPGKTYTYSTYAIHPKGKRIKFGWDWNGDKKVDQWTKFYNSGENVEIEHSWSSKGVYNVRVIAKDTDGKYSEWSDPLPVTVPLSKKPVKKTKPKLLHIRLDRIVNLNTQHLISFFHFWRSNDIFRNRGYRPYDRGRNS
ncbi:MAG TPA: hypothetical protein ENF43_01080 [Thermoplasmatales archaeon]|nr:hypothetical protein [Thermoplasmatales archaeon]